MLMKCLVMLLLGSFLLGCSTGIHTSGSVVMLKGEAPQVSPVSENTNVEIFIDKPVRPFEVIALVHASSDVMDYTFIAEYEAAIFNELRRQAGRAGADGVMNIVREVVSGGTLVTTDNYGAGWGGRYDADGNWVMRADELVLKRSTQSTRISNNYSVVFRGQAIRYTDR